jgi:hypothetical protein
MVIARIPTHSIEPREYEKLQLLLDQEGLSVSECVRKLISLYTTYKLTTGKAYWTLNLMNCKRAV